MPYRFKVPIGDWSDDGHGKCDTYIIEANHPVQDLRQAYKDSCKLTGISFNHNQDYTGLNLGYGSERQIATEYGNSSISNETIEILKSFNIDYNFELDDEVEDYTIGGSEDFLDLLMAFIKLSIPDLQWKMKEEELEYLNGYWNSELNVGFGYGLFD